MCDWEHLNSQHKTDLYLKDGLSIYAIAKEFNTYPNKVRRDLIKLGVTMRSRSESQKLALETGRSNHPTQGMSHNEVTKRKIGNSVAESWESLSDEELETRREIGRQSWDDKTDEEKDMFHKLALQEIHKAAREGSKLEKYLQDKLIDAGYDIDFHTKFLIANEKVHIDIVVIKLGIAIEIDGPSHTSPIWGEKAYRRNRKTDTAKNGLLINNGFKVIRVQYDKNLSEKYKREVWKKLHDLLKKHKKLKPLTHLKV